MKHWHWVDPSVVRARIAALQHIDLPGDARLGYIVLREHQREAADAGGAHNLVCKSSYPANCDQFAVSRVHTGL